jgi:puromycin-sensitive aminopeptidase
MQTVNKSNKTGYESLLRVYRETDLSQEKVRVLGKSMFFFLLPFNDELVFSGASLNPDLLVGSLASSPDHDVVREVLNFILSPEVIRPCSNLAR